MLAAPFLGNVFLEVSGGVEDVKMAAVTQADTAAVEGIWTSQLKPHLLY